MADPLTILGAAAASFQFANYAIKGLFKTIELVEDVREAPQRMSQLLSHIDREVEQINNLLHPDSSVFAQLSITQYAHISKPAIEARKLLLDIQQDLHPLVDISEDPSKPNRRWKTIVRVWNSLKNEKDLETKMMSWDRLNTSLQRELQISGVETQLLLRDQSSQILASVITSTTEIQEMRQLIESRAALTDALGHHVIEFRESLNQGFASASQNLIQIKDGLSNLHQDIGGSTTLLSTQFQTQLSDHRSEFRSLIQDIRSELRSELIGLATQHSYNRNSDPIDNRNSTFEIDLRHGIARLEASCHATQSDAELEDRMQLYGPSKSLRCRCRGGNNRSRWACGRLAFRYETRAVKSCPIHGKKQSYSYSIEANLNPFLRGTLELTLGLLSGVKGWQIAPPLKFKSTVKRSESLLFQAFDQWGKDFFDFLTRPKIHTPGPSNIIVDINSEEESGLVWKCHKQFVRSSILKLARRIEEVIKSGHASGGDVDEDGSTLLTEIFYLPISLGFAADVVASELGHLLEIARVSEVDPMATSQVKTKYTPLRSRNLRMRNPPLTAIQSLVSYSMDDRSPSISFFRTVRNYDGLFDSLESFRGGHIFHLELLQDMFLACPEVAEGFGYSESCMAVIRRCLPDLKKLYHSSQQEKDLERGRLNHLTPATLAVGWPEGLRFLVDQGCDTLQAFELACKKKDEESASILLSTNHAIFSQHYAERYQTGKYYTPIFRMVTDELRRRQDCIKKLASQYLNQYERDRVSISEPWALDVNGREIYHLLEQRTNVPNKLDCLGGSPHCLRVGYFIEHHNILYDAGFTDLDVTDEYNNTPLSNLCETYYINSNVVGRLFEGSSADRTVQSRKWNDAILWFLERGARPNFRPSRCRPHLLFYLCLVLSADEVDKRIAEACSYNFVTDQCECFCSPRGCIPPFGFWRCGDRYHSRGEWCKIRLACRTENLQRWTSTLKLSRMLKEYCYRAICQLELFERLGMVHTCCKCEEEFKYDIIEKRRIRSEDKLSVRHLGKLLRLYKNTRRLFFDFPIEHFWTIWWEAVNHILPPLLPEEACTWPDILDREGYKNPRRYEFLCKEYLDIPTRRREERWMSILEAAGYGGMDFEEVINCHFTKFLVLCKALLERRDARRRRRLVGSPRSMQLRRRRRHNITAQGSLGLHRTS
ncbi:hypothetical protein M434DRAFT_8269 [Hypoxylon sp. CO27-5]|nr:hypothetical protein M434DRAFT_8269 [Hypoxylon sp. CO27-5]